MLSNQNRNALSRHRGRCWNNNHVDTTRASVYIELASIVHSVRCELLNKVRRIHRIERERERERERENLVPVYSLYTTPIQRDIEERRSLLMFIFSLENFHLGDERIIEVGEQQLAAL